MSTKTRHIVASDCDKELLSSGLHSDVRVECGDKTWDLHLAIIMTRCPFFKKATIYNGVIEIDGLEPKRAGWAIYFIYTGKLPDDVLKSLETSPTVMGTSIDLFILANFFGLDGLRERAVQVITEYLVFQAEYIQRNVMNYGGNLKRMDVGEFHEEFLETVRTVYNQLELQPLKSVLMHYLKLTRYIVLREQLLGERLLTDPTLARFQTDILKETLFRPFAEEYEFIKEKCTKCDCPLKFAARFGDTVGGESQDAWCRECKPLGEKRVMELLGSKSGWLW